VRVVIEHLISGAKRWRIMKQEMRLKVENISDVLMEIACGTQFSQPNEETIFQRVAITTNLLSIRCE